ncbi:MAG: transglycosylase domain-containing protein [Actinomycetota bacterium]|nr:transglycosylase domain-containing protein [Actinomycetota bacterium]
MLFKHGGRTSHPRRILLFALVALVTASCEALPDLPEVKRSDLRFRPAQSSRIVAADGSTITTLHARENRTVVPLQSIPKHVQRAVVAIEDERFYRHDGVDLKAVVRAAITNATTGEIKEGGSTITQQYVKNVIISPGRTAEKTLKRKLEEAALSRQLERLISKREILWRYLNTVYFGQGAYGIQAAARTYFGKPAARLTLAEGALLAGLVRSPETYDPFDYPRAARARRNLVLAKMAQLGWASPRAVERAGRKKLGLRPEVDKERYPAPYFVDYVKRLITYDPRFRALGKTVAQRTHRLFKGGLSIYTTIDLDMQAAAEDAVASVLAYKRDPHGSLVAIDPKTGQVKAMVGGRDWFAPRRKDRFAKLNLAIQAEPNLGCVKVDGKCERRAPGTGRQAGSAFKPFALAAAIEEGIPLSRTYQASDSIVIPGADNGGDYRVENYEGSAYGSISLLEATVKSVNVVYAQLAQDVGYDAVTSMGERMGISTALYPFASAVLGTNLVNPLGMASAFGTLAAGGVQHPPVAVTKVVGPNGKVLYRDRSDGEQALNAAVTYLTTSALQQVIERGTGVAAQIGRPAAGKTGTAQEWRDAWFVGYTPDLVASVWVGYPEAAIEMKPSCEGSTARCRPTRIQVTGGSWPAEIWQKFMSSALAGVPARAFPSADVGLETVTIDTRNGCLAGDLTPPEHRAQATFAPGTAPTEVCPEETDLVEVPEVLGFPLGQAVDVLEDAGFEVTTREQKTSTYPPGRVLRQEPGPGSSASPGSAITLIVSRRAQEPEKAEVPDVLGLTRGAAESRLTSAGFRVRSIAARPGRSTRSTRGRVWKQSPAAGSEAEPGATVTIWIDAR